MEAFISIHKKFTPYFQIKNIQNDSKSLPIPSLEKEVRVEIK